MLLTPYTPTVKPVYKDRSRDQKSAVFIDRWSLYTGELQ